MIVVHFKRIHDSHDCWGKYESYITTEVMEFDSVHKWLEYRKGKNIKFVALYEVSSVIREGSK